MRSTAPSPRKAADVAPVAARPATFIWVGLFWLVGSLVVIAAQPGLDRKASAAVAAAAGVAAILLVRLLTPEPSRRYLRSLVAGMIAVTVAAVWMLRALLASGANSGGTNFFVDGLQKRITLPLMFVLLAPLVIQALPRELLSPRELWRQRATLWRRSGWLDRIVLAYCVVAVPAILLGVAHRNPHSYLGQDLGLVVFLVFTYVAGRAADAAGALDWADELVDILLALAVAHFVLFGWNPSPIYNFIEAACAGALAFAFFRPSRSRLLSACIAVAILVGDAVAVRNGTNSTVTISLVGALGIVAYLLIRRRDLVPQWLVVALAVVALAGFIGFTSDGRTLRGQYHGADPSNAGRTFEAERIRAAVRHSPVSLVFGRGFGSTIDETGAPRAFADSLAAGGRDLAHVQEVHLLVYASLLKEGLLGVLWLVVFSVAVLVLGVRALERSARTRDPSLVVYAALAMLGLVAALAAASHLQANPLDGLSVGLLVGCLAGTTAAPVVENRQRTRPKA